MFVVCLHHPCDIRMLYSPETGLLDVRPCLWLVASLHVPGGWQGMPGAERATESPPSTLENSPPPPPTAGGGTPVPSCQHPGCQVQGCSRPGLSVLCDARARAGLKVSVFPGPGYCAPVS